MKFTKCLRDCSDWLRNYKTECAHAEHETQRLKRTQRERERERDLFIVAYT